MISFKKFQESTDVVNAFSALLNHPKVRPHVENAGDKIKYITKKAETIAKTDGAEFIQGTKAGIMDAMGPGAVGEPSHSLPVAINAALVAIRNRHKIISKAKSLVGKK
jgi:hypothetical protein